ncbi:PTS sugar transporter subunit IIA [Paenibacillus athensensis]|uniref:Mannitol-specific phosphotransferase enzyme IIA component n=1 Tax=Paenibacillus athensensis TaxID=1967502 RepID=A0A4Y8Q754_9BACL|nr:PTS sugar transporter subunit IIA [Paenibacillus athensensis]MCD1257360.1 PTS sugar transporter subunit IIA [Paenibacillus athensensis]
MGVLTLETIRVQADVATKEEAIRLAGQLLVDAGHVTAAYIDKMLEREALVSTYMGGGLAIPHGTKEAKALIASTGISIVQIPAGVDYEDGEKAYLVVGIAAAGDEHMEILTQIALICAEDDQLDVLLKTDNAEAMLRIFEGGSL